MTLDRKVAIGCLSFGMVAASLVGGGKQNFIRKLQDEHVSFANLPPVLSTRLKAFEKPE